MTENLIYLRTGQMKTNHSNLFMAVRQNGNDRSSKATTCGNEG